MYIRIRAARGNPTPPCTCRGSDAAATEGGAGRLRASVCGETGQVGRTSAVGLCQGSQRPVSYSRSYARFAGFSLPQEMVLEDCWAGIASISIEHAEVKKRFTTCRPSRPGRSPFPKNLPARPACTQLNMENCQPCLCTVRSCRQTLIYQSWFQRHQA